MALVAVTRLRVRSARFLLSFAVLAWRSRFQARRARGNLGVRLRRLPGRVFWTLTVWQDEAAMGEYRITPPHSDAMPRLLGWCDEASVVHWLQDGVAVPDWAVAEQHMAAAGRLSKVKHPSTDQRAGRLDFVRVAR